MYEISSSSFSSSSGSSLETFCLFYKFQKFMTFNNHFSPCLKNCLILRFWAASSCSTFCKRYLNIDSNNSYTRSPFSSGLAIILIYLLHFPGDNLFLYSWFTISPHSPNCAEKEPYTGKFWGSFYFFQST